MKTRIMSVVIGVAIAVVTSVSQAAFVDQILFGTDPGREAPSQGLTLHSLTAVTNTTSQFVFEDPGDVIPFGGGKILWKLNAPAAGNYDVRVHVHDSTTEPPVPVGFTGFNLFVNGTYVGLPVQTDVPNQLEIWQVTIPTAGLSDFRIETGGGGVKVFDVAIIPEPTTVALLGLAAGLLALRRRRMQRK